MAMVPVRKEYEGGASGRLDDGSAWSFEWDADGAVVEVPYEVALDLLSIPHGGYSVAEEGAPAAQPEPEDTSEDGAEDIGGGEQRLIEEPAAGPDAGELSEEPPARRRAAKKTAAKASVEE